MIKHYKFFKWDSKYNHPEIKLDDDADELLKLELIIPKEHDDDNMFLFDKDQRIQIQTKDNKVKLIYFTDYSGLDFFKIETSLRGEKAVADVTAKFNLKLKQLIQYNSIEDFKKEKVGDFLIVSFSDYFARRIMLIRR
jgi:hypothetical protein